ncbi:MAG: galactosyltransferase-related protein [Pseudomonadota bacterium]
MKLAVIIPYRDRVSHLREFIPLIRQELQSQEIEFEIFLVEQSVAGAFNKGRCCNVGFALASGFDWFCFHDVDLVPIEKSDYSWPTWPTQLVHASSKHDYQVFDDVNLGGVCLFQAQHYQLINGFSNNFWGWGCEDNQLSWRCTAAGLKIEKRNGIYRHLPDERPADMSRYEENLAYLSDPLEYANDGLNSLTYELLEHTKGEDYTRILVSFDDFPA